MGVKKFLALLLSAILAVALLAACGAGSVQHNALVQLLNSELENVEVIGDSSFDRALKNAVQRGGSDPEAVLAALKEELGLTGVVNFSASILGGSSVGSTALKVEFEAVASSSVAANAAANSWLGVLRYLPADGAYSAKVSMVEVNGGYILAIEVTVEQPGSSSSSDDDDDNSKPDTVVNGTGFSYNVTQEEVTVTRKDGLKNLFDTTNTDSALTEARNTNFEGITITLKPLEGNETYTVDGRLAETFKGTLQGESAGSKAPITLSGEKGLFGTLEGGQVLYLDITVTGEITGTVYSNIGSAAGAVADVNNGCTITGCKVTLNSGSITANENTESLVAFAGGIVGYNKYGGRISECTVTVSTANGISATGNGSTAITGGIVGRNNGGIVVSCNPVASAQATANGVAGNYTATISAGSGSTTATDNNPLDDNGAQAGILCGYDSKNNGNPTP